MSEPKYKITMDKTTKEPSDLQKLRFIQQKMDQLTYDCSMVRSEFRILRGSLRLIEDLIKPHLDGG
jgi:hypothetical protein